MPAEPPAPRPDPGATKAAYRNPQYGFGTGRMLDERPLPIDRSASRRAAAVVAFSLGPERAADLLSELDPELQTVLAYELSRLGNLSDMEMEASLAAFADELQARKAA